MDYFHDLLIPELIRYAKLENMDSEKLDESGAAVYSVWYLLNPLNMTKREQFWNFEEDTEPIIYNKKSAEDAYGSVAIGGSPSPKKRSSKKGVRFTAHSHLNEPLEPSPDDLLIYANIRFSDKKGESETINFIVDGFTCRKVD